jgi:hypothetical protein
LEAFDVAHQSSFLIRCRLVLSDDAGPEAHYIIQHIHTGAEYRTTSPEEMTRWMTAQTLNDLDNAKDKEGRR